ncbi:hypothetical protein AA313_de0202821 [Arthrobotrys entomopaga]|nr:hypothetical protein AA313_de0202821 [Arthrobotrys entomopaga]
METGTGICSLPTELILEITRHLNYASILALRLTCRHLNETTNRPTEYNMADLLEIELWPPYHYVKYGGEENQQPDPFLDYFACYKCLKIKRAVNFSNAMMRAKRGKLANFLSPDRLSRFCIPCGIRSGSYIKGAYFDYGGRGRYQGVVCVHCGLLKDSSWTLSINPRTCFDCRSMQGC